MRYLFTLVFFLALALPASASTFIRGINTINTGSSTSTQTIVVPAVVANDEIVLCAANSTGGAITQSQSGWTAYGSPSANTQWGACWTRVALGTETTFSYTFTTSGFVSGEIFTVGNTDGSIPVLESPVTIANTNTAGSLVANAVTTTQGGDFIAFVALSSWPAGWPSPVATSFFHNDNGVCESLGFVSEAGTGASITPTFSPGHANAIQIITFAFKSSSTTPIAFIGVGNEFFSNTSPSTVNPSVPTNGSTSDVNFVAIREGTNTGITIIPPQDIVPRTLPCAGTGAVGCISQSSGANVLTLSAGEVAIGDMMIVSQAYGGGAPTPPAGWNAICNDITSFRFYLYSRVANSTDAAGTSYTWNLGGATTNAGFADYHSVVGQILSIDGASACSHSSGANPAPPSIITGTANEAVQTIVAGGSANTPVIPAGSALVWNLTGQSEASSYFPQLTAGTIPTQTYTASSTSYELGTIGIKGSSATASPWTKVCSTAVDPTATTELDIYEATGITPGSTLTFFFSSPPAIGDAVDVDFANVNTTTPVDRCSVPLGTGGMGNPMVPSVTPTTSDEVLFRVSTLGYVNSPLVVGGKYTNLIFNGVNNGLTISYEPLQNATAEVITNQGLTSPFASLSTGLNATNTPARTSAHIDMNQTAIEIFATTAPIPPAATNPQLWINIQE